MSQTPALPTYSAIYAFGDSLSDAGNLSIFTSLTGTEPVSPPYYQEKYGDITGNVFSNGPTWVQDLSIALGLGTLTPSLTGGTDFAYGGAETGATPQNANNPEIEAISLPSQILQFRRRYRILRPTRSIRCRSARNDLFDILAATRPHRVAADHRRRTTPSPTRSASSSNSWAMARRTCCCSACPISARCRR